MSKGRLAALLDGVIRDGRGVLDGEGERLDCAGLDAAAQQVAAGLFARGLLAGEPVLVVLGNRPADIASLLGIWRAGGVAVPVAGDAPPAVPAGRRSRVGARLTIGRDGVEGPDTGRMPRTIVPDAALVNFTSGSTGEPKGVVVGHERLAGKLAVLDRLLRLRSDDVVLVPLRLTFIFGLWVTLLGLRAGARVQLMPRFSASGVAEALARGVTVAGVVPTMLRSLPPDSPRSESALRLMLTGGEPLGAALADRMSSTFPGVEIVDLYGSTETGSCDFCMRGRGAGRLGPIGMPTEDVEHRIAGEDGRPVAPGASGELCIRSPYGMLGYLDAPELTAAAFDGGFFRTGDLARQRPDGLVELVGRRKDIISRGGVKIAPLELDLLFAGHPDVAAALAGSVPDPRLGEAVHVLVVQRKGARIDADGLRAWAAGRIERDKLPDGIHVVDVLPVGGTGKADRGAIARLLAAT